MTDAMNPFERNLARALDEYLGPRRPVDERAISRAAIASRPAPLFALPGMSARSSQRLALLALVALTVVALLATAFVVGQQRPLPTTAPSPSPSRSQLAVVPPSARPSAQATGQPTLPTPGPVAFQSYYPIFAQPGAAGSVDIYVALPDGSQKHLASFGPRDPVTVDSDVPGLQRIRFNGSGSVSGDGWLALGIDWSQGAAVRGAQGYAIVNLANPDAAPWVVAASLARPGAWTQLTGAEATNFAALNPVDPQASGGFVGRFEDMQVINPSNQTIERVPAAPFGSRIMWATPYGDGPIVSAPDDALGNIYGVYSLSDNAVRPGLQRANQVDGQRPIGADGWTLCNRDGVFFQELSGCGNDTLAIARGDGSVQTWTVPMSGPQTLDGATFAADGTAIWELIAGDPDQPLELRRATEPQNWGVIRTIDRSIAPASSSVGTDALIAGIAPDDSQILITAGRLLVIPTDGSEVHAFYGTPLGFVSPDVLDIRPPVIGSPLPFVTPYPPVPTASTTPSPTAASSLNPIPALIPIEGPYLPVIARTDGTTLSILVGEMDGTERLVRSISLDGYQPGEYLPEVSVDGWLYVEAQDPFGYVDLFYDLKQPDSPVWKRTAKPQATQQRWGPNGLLATDNGNTFVDPRTHSVFHPLGDVYFGGGPYLSWTADGTAVYTNGERNLVPIDGSPAYTGILPTWDPILGRDVGADGKVLCDLSLLYLGTEPTGCNDDRAGIVSQSTGFVDLGADLPQSLIVESTSFAADQTSLWVFGLESGKKGPLQLVRVGESTTVVATIEPGTDPFSTLPDTLKGFAGFAGLAPDDSMLVVSDNYDNPQRVYISGDGSSVAAHQGEFCGFVPESLAATWPTATP